MNRCVVCIGAVLALGGAFAEVPVSQRRCTLLDLPVSGVTNRAYLTSMASRPWWNREWTRRAPILVSSHADVAEPKAIVDCVVDFGERVEPDDVRVVTPWETVVPCVAEPRAADTAIRLIFQTPLRIHENKPFLVYWGREGRDRKPRSAADRPQTPLQMFETADEIRILNGVLDVTIDRKHVTGGFLKRIRVMGSDSPNELLERATQWAWNGLEMTLGGETGWEDGVVTDDNAFVKRVRFGGTNGAVVLSVYADQPRVDWAYELVRGEHCELNVSWAVGGGVAYDDFHYPGAAGKTLTFRAALDGTTDCIPSPRFEMAPWFGAGWYAIASGKSANVCGMLFDRPALQGLWYNSHGQAFGEWTRLTFAHRTKTGETATGSGSLVALAGRPADVEREYLRRKAPLTVSVGGAEPYADRPYVRPRLDRDFIADINCGKDTGHGWRAGFPLSDPAWASNVVDHLRSYGVTGVRVGGYAWWDMPITERNYRELEKSIGSDIVAPDCRKRLTGWAEGKYDGRDFLAMANAAHAKGLAVKQCGDFIPGAHGREFAARFDAEIQKTALHLHHRMAEVGGVDVIYNLFEGQEQVILPEDVKKARGNDYWNWKDKDEFFAWQEKARKLVKAFYDESKRLRPDVPVLVYNSENGELGREMFMSEQIGSFDTVVVEMLSALDFSRCKHVAKRMRALFDNEAGRTVHHHYYFMQPDAMHRIKEIELPFICGVNGFSHENQSYENYTRELSEIAGDFYRFAEYTELGRKAARMAPVRYLGVFRDSECYREDIRKGRYGLPKGRPYFNRAEQDGRCRALGEIRNLDFDFVMNPFFTAKALAKYRIVYVPEDDVFSARLADEALAYVEQGGSLVLEGVTGERVRGFWGERAKGLEDGRVLTCGAGKVLWYKDVRTDRLARRDAKTIREVAADIEKLAGPMPHRIEGAPSLDGVLQSGPDGLLLGVHNVSDRADKGKVTVDLRLAERAAPLWVLDVKRGVRFAYTNGFEITIGPRQCGFYLIGGDKFTAVPKTRPAVWNGPVSASSQANGRPPQAAADPSFVPAKAVEFTRGDKTGAPIPIRRSREACVDVTQVTPANYYPPVVRKALAGATYVHFAKLAGMDAEGRKAYDDLFVSCADELRGVLKRGGTLLFDMSPTEPNARRFLASVDVYDPYARLAPANSSKGAAWTSATNHPFAGDAKAQRGQFESVRAFAEWDAAKQVAPVRRVRNVDEATFVFQENVLGAGRVVFLENVFAFGDWYENIGFGNALLGWIIGCPVEEHAKKARLRIGGTGTVQLTGKEKES